MVDCSSGISPEITIRRVEAYGEKETRLDYTHLGNWLKDAVFVSNLDFRGTRLRPK